MIKGAIGLGEKLGEKVAEFCGWGEKNGIILRKSNNMG